MRQIATDDNENGTHMKAFGREMESSSDTDEETMEIEEENTMKACILLSDLLCLHKKAFEASSELAAQPTLAALREKIVDAHAEEMQELDCVGKILEILVSHPVHAKQSAKGFNGLWKDDSSRFYSGAVIEIREDSWVPRGFDQESGTKFCRDPHGLVERRHDGHEKRMSVSPAPDSNGLVITLNGQKFDLQVYYGWDRWEHFDVLSQVWDVLNAVTIGWIMVESGPHANKFVHSLTVQVPPDIAGNLSLVTLPYEDHVDNVMVLPGELGRCRSEEQFRKMLPAAWTKKQKHDMCCGRNRFLHHIFRKYKEKTPVSYYYCGVQGLFDYQGPSLHNSMDHVEIMLYLEMPSDSSFMFTTPLGQAISANTWKNAFPQFVWQRSMDLVFQVMLSFSLAPAARHIDKDDWLLPDRWQFLMIELLMIRNLINSLLEAALMIRLWTRERDDDNVHAVVPLPVNSVTLMRFGIEFYSIGYGCLLAWDYGADIWKNDLGNVPLVKKGCLVKHPMALSVLIFIKFLQFMMSLLNFKMFRASLLPTWFAIKSKESATFLLYMVMLTFGCALAYMALPYASTLEKEDDNFPLRYFRPFFLMFRLNIMGDFSVDELMGQQQVLRESNHTASFTYVIDGDGPESHRLGPFLNFAICLLALIFPVIFLNVYVGLVGEAYTNVKSNLLQISNSYVVASVHRELLHRQFWRSICGGMCSFDLCRRPVRREGKGTFIRLPSALASKPLEVAS